MQRRDYADTSKICSYLSFHNAEVSDITVTIIVVLLQHYYGRPPASWLMAIIFY